MDWKSQLASSIEAAVERSMYATVEESTEEKARRHKRWLRIKLVEDMVRRDPVYAEKLARRHAAFRDSIAAAGKVAMATSSSAAASTTLITRAPTTCSTSCPSRAVATSVSGLTATAASTSSTSAGGIIPERCCYDPELAASTPTSSRSDLPAPAVPIMASTLESVQTVSVLNEMDTSDPAAASVAAEATSQDYDLTSAPPAKCSMVCPRGGPSSPSPASTLTEVPDQVASPPSINVDIMDSSGSAALVNMSVQLDTAEGADTVVTDEDKRLLAGSSVERPLALVAVRAVADDRSFVTGTYAMPLTLAALGVDDDRVANTCKCTQAMVKSLNQLQAKGSGLCYDFDSATTRSLLPWDPGETPRVSRDSVLSSDSVWGASAQQMHADFTDSYDRHHQPGEVLRYLFHSTGPSLISITTQQEFVEKYSVASSSSVGREDELRSLPWPSFMCCWGGMWLGLPTNQVLCEVGTSTVSEGWSLAIERKPWPSPPACLMSHHMGETTIVQCPPLLGMCGNLPKLFLELDNQMQWTEEKKLVNISAAANQATSWTGNQPVSQVWTVFLSNFNGGFSLEHLWDPGIELFQMQQFQWQSALQKYTSLSGFRAFINGRAEVQQHYLVQWEIPWIKSLVFWKSRFQDCSLGRESLYGSVSLWKLAWSNLFDVLAIQSTCELGSYILWSQTAVLLLLAYATSPFQKPMEQWDPGIARWITRHIRRGNTHYSELLEWSYLQSDMGFCIPWNILFCCRVLEQWKIPWTVSLVSVKSRFSYSSYAVNCHVARVPAMLSDRFQRTEESTCGTSLKLVVYLVHPALNIADQGRLTSYRPLTVWICYLIIARTSLYINLLNARQLVRADISSQRQFYYGAHTFSSNTHEEIVQANFIVRGVAAWQVFGARFRFTELYFLDDMLHNNDKESLRILILAFEVCAMPNFVEHHKASYRTVWIPSGSGVAIAALQIWLSQFMELLKGKGYGNIFCEPYLPLFSVLLSGKKVQMSWYSGNGEIIGFSEEDCKHAEAKRAINVNPIFLYINSAQIGNNYYRNQERQVPWDPGGLIWHRLEVKPNFKEGGMLATTYSRLGWATDYWAWAARGQRKRATTSTQGIASSDSALERTASAS